MTLQVWLQLATLALSAAVLLVAAGRAFGRTEAKTEPASRRDDDSGKLVIRQTDPDCAELARRFNLFEEEWRQNRETWHAKFNAFEQARTKMLNELDRLYLRQDVADEKFNGVWHAVKEVRTQTIAITHRLNAKE